jgi:hypothetical protein
VSIATSSRLKTLFLPFGGKLSGNNRWINLAELIPWDEFEDGYPAQFCKGLGAPAKLFRMALGACRTLRRGPAAAVETQGF